ncbi:MAG TPA: hypothetical protein VE891_01725 [Allosphingosinicella sp.]|nr:hypothetical protein [Allosphingosinicella sp.]
MKRPLGPDLQRAIEFLSSPDLANSDQGSLPARPDYEILARHASGLGHDLSPDALREAFRVMMRARLMVLRKPPRTAGDDR